MNDELNTQNSTLSDAIDRVMKNFEDVNEYFIEKVAEQIKAVGKLRPRR